MDALHRHRSLYKGTTPPWKETYRKRCVERLKNSRSRLLEKYRQIGTGEQDGSSSYLVEEVMEEEWSALQAANKRLPSLWAGDGINHMQSVMQDKDEFLVLEEIHQELMLQEMAIIEEYQKSLQFEEQFLNAMVEGMENDQCIICPVCSVHNLIVKSHSISCQCGVHINTMHRNITSEVLRSLLERTVTEHMGECPHNPAFSMASSDGCSNLMVSCSVCDYLAVVL